MDSWVILVLGAGLIGAAWDVGRRIADKRAIADVLPRLERVEAEQVSAAATVGSQGIRLSRLEGDAKTYATQSDLVPLREKITNLNNGVESVKAGAQRTPWSRVR